MARGKNYVNNNRGVYLQAGPKGKANMKLCEYGLGCTRPDCIYRHEEGGTNNGGRSDVCIPFLAGKCSFEGKGCRRLHPPKDEVARLLAKYKRTRCRFGDECYTDGCLYLHPRDAQKDEEPAFVEPHHFPPLNGGNSKLDGPSSANRAPPKPIPNSAWNAAPVGPPKKLVSASAPVAVPGPVPENEQHRSQDHQIPMQGPPYPNHSGYGIQTPTAGDQPQKAHENAPPQPSWGYSDELHHEPLPIQYQQQHHPYANMMMQPSRDYYGGPPIADGGQFPPMVDPNTGYPIDPRYYEPNLYHHQEQQHQEYHPHMAMANGGMPFPPPYYNIVPTPYGITFNAEAKEFVPGNSASN